MYVSHLKHIYGNGIKIQVDNQTLSLITSGFIHWINAIIVVGKGKGKDNLVSKTTRMSGVLSVTYISFYKVLTKMDLVMRVAFGQGILPRIPASQVARYIQLLD